MPGRKQNELSYQQFKQVLESGDVGSLIIYQNEQTPTGEVRLANHAGEVYVTYVSDVNQTQQMLQDLSLIHILPSSHTGTLTLLLSPRLLMMTAHLFSPLMRP